jgi:hypothetical protein
METHFAKAARSTPLTKRQLSIVVGSLLGDASLQPTTAGHCFRVHHGLAQQRLVEWKYEELRGFVRTPPRQSGRAVYFRTVSHPAFDELAAAAYDRRVKVVPFEFLERHFTALSLAVLIMDDGCSEGRQLRINTQSFSDADVGALCEFLSERFSLRTTINRDKGRPRIRISAESMRRLIEIVDPYVLPELRYKIDAGSPRRSAPKT